jgi:hypothetical protein
MKEISGFEESYKKLNNAGDADKIEFLEFVWEVMKTPFTEYNYSLIGRSGSIPRCLRRLMLQH